MHVTLFFLVFLAGIRVPVSHPVILLQCDLLDMPAVGQLEKDGKYALVYQLLKIFLTHRLDAYLDFHAANSTLLKSYGEVFSPSLLFSLLFVSDN